MSSVLRICFRPGLAVLAGLLLMLTTTSRVQAQDAAAPAETTATAEAPAPAAEEAPAPAAPPTAEEVLGKLTVGIDTIWVLVCSMLVFFMNL